MAGQIGTFVKAKQARKKQLPNSKRIDPRIEPPKQLLKKRGILTTGDKAVTDIVEIMDSRMHAEQKRREKIRQTWRELQKKGFGYRKEGRKSAILNYEDGRMLYDILPDKAWKDQRCFIIGGGASLKGFDFSKLKNELTIGINRAYEIVDCTINYAMDNNLYHWIRSGKLGQESKKKFEDFKGIPVWLDSANYNYPRGIFILNKFDNHKKGLTMRNGLKSGTNAGFGALNLAICLGANPIYLLGFDMEGKNGNEVWWHDGYPERRGDKIYDKFIDDFRRIEAGIREKGIRVVNLNSESKLKCFEFGKFEDIKPIERPIIVSYYTKGTGYESEVEHLKTTLRRFNLENNVVGISDKGNWHKNTYYKPQFILRMMNKYRDRSIVFVDADAKIRMNPVLFNDLKCDFACHFRYPKKELLSGTLYFGNTKGARYLVNKWIRENELHPKTHMPQKNLRAVFDKEKGKIKWRQLPVEYCMIYDSSFRHTNNPIVEHYQLSRKYKERTGKKNGYAMKKDLTEIQEFCREKRICLLGNANSILNKKKSIDSFDIVCRMNRGASQGKEEFVGSRTDILFLSTHMNGENIHKSFNPQFVVWMTVCHRLASLWTLRNAIQNPKRDWVELYGKLDINPTTGLMALNFILKRIDFKSLAIYGFDFFATKTWYNTRIDSGQKHSGKKEKKLFMDMIANNKKVEFMS